MDTTAHRRTRRFALLSAGAAGVIIAIAVYAALWTPGTLDLSSMPRTSQPPLVTWVAPNGPAWSAGIRPGATIMGDRPQRGASAGLVVRQGHSRITVGLERTRVELLDLLDGGVGLCVVLFGALVLMKGQDDRRAAVAFWRMSLPIGLAMGVIPAGFHGVLWAIALTFVALALFGPALLDLTLVFPSTDTPVLLRRLIWLPALVLLAFYIPCWRYPAPLFVLVSNASDGLLAAYILAACARLVWALRHPRSALQRTQLRFLTCGLVGAFLPLALFNLVPYLLAGRDLAPPQASILALVVLLFSVGVAIVRTEFFGITSLLHRRPLRIVVGLVVLIGAAAAATGLATAGTQWWGWPASASAARASTLAVLGGLALWPWLVRRAERLLLHGGADPADTMLRVSATLAHAEVDTLGPLVVAHLST